MSSIVLLYEDKPRYDKQLKLLVSIILALTMIPGLIFINIYIEIALTLLGVTAFDGLLFAVVIPRNYQIFRDRVRIKLGGPLAINIPLEDIKEAKHAGASEAFVYWGLRLATSTSTVIEIVRHKGMSVVISPLDDELFLAQLAQARKSVIGEESK